MTLAYGELTRQEMQDILVEANACIEAVDMTPYANAYMIWRRDRTGKIEVVVIPLRKPVEQAN